MPWAPQRADVPVTIDESKCIDGCPLCVDMCPLDSLAIDDSRGKAYMHVDECWYCGPCAARCPTGAVGPGHARRGGAGQCERGGTRTCERRQDGLRGARVSMSLPISEFCSFRSPDVGQGFVQASGSSARLRTSSGSLAAATWARVTSPRTFRTLARTAIHSGSSDSAGPQ